MSELTTPNQFAKVASEKTKQALALKVEFADFFSRFSKLGNANYADDYNKMQSVSNMLDEIFICSLNNDLDMATDTKQ